MRADFLQFAGNPENVDLASEYRELLEAYDRGGLPFERTLTRLRFASWLLARGDLDQAEYVNRVALNLARHYAMRTLEADSLTLAAAISRRRGDQGLFAVEQHSPGSQPTQRL
jgi:hypothetical protein